MTPRRDSNVVQFPQRTIERIEPDSPPRRLSRAGILVVTAIVGFVLAFVVLSW